jgi:urease
MAVKGCRSVKKKDMKWNDKTPKMEVDPETYVVKADGVIMTVPPATKVPLAGLYNIF